MEEKKQLLLALKRRRRRSTHTAFRSLSEYLWANTWNRCQFVNLRQVFTLFSSTDLETRQQHCHIHVQHEDPGHFSFNEINGWRTKIPKEHSVWKSPKMSHLKKNSPNWPILAFLMNFCPKCRHSSLCSQCCKMRLFLWFSNTVSKNSIFSFFKFNNRLFYGRKLLFAQLPVMLPMLRIWP